MDTEFTCIKMVLGTKECGRMTYNMDREKKFGRIAQCTKVIITKEKNMGKAFTFGKMAQATMEIGLRTESKARESINGKMDEHMMECGKIIICMEKEPIPGQTAEDTKVNTKWTRNMGLESTSGLTVVYMKATG